MPDFFYDFTHFIYCQFCLYITILWIAHRKFSKLPNFFVVYYTETERKGRKQTRDEQIYGVFGEEEDDSQSRKRTAEITAKFTYEQYILFSDLYYEYLVYSIYKNIYVGAIVV